MTTAWSASSSWAIAAPRAVAEFRGMQVPPVDTGPLPGDVLKEHAVEPAEHVHVTGDGIGE